MVQDHCGHRVKNGSNWGSLEAGSCAEAVVEAQSRERNAVLSAPGIKRLV